MKGSGIIVTRSALEGFTDRLLRRGYLPLKEGRASAWLERTFRVVISEHGLQNYIMVFLHEHANQLEPFTHEEIRAMLADWYSRQPSAELEERHEKRG